VLLTGINFVGLLQVLTAQSIRLPDAASAGTGLGLADLRDTMHNYCQ
jgi:hypothetical protein